MQQKKLPVRELVLIGIFTAIIILLTYTPLGYINFGPISITTLHIPVILGAILLRKIMLGAVLGGIWGVTAMIYAFQSAGVLNPIFYNPLVSVVPRIFVGMITLIVFHITKRFLARRLSISIAAIFGTITNTVLVLSAIYLFGQDVIIQAGIATNPTQVLTFVLSLVTINALLEILAAAIIVPLVAYPLDRMIDKNTTTDITQHNTLKDE